MPSPSRHRARWRRSYPIVVQLGLAMALLVLIAAFRMDWQPPPADERFRTVVLDDVPMIEVPITRDEPRPPPPPVPPAPMEVPDETLVEDDLPDFDVGLEIGETLETPLPPLVNDPEGDEPEVYEFIVVEQGPALVGGLAALYERIEYPEMARRAGLEGQVTLRFVVDTEGRVVEPEVLKGVHPLLDAAALDALRQVRFTPGRQRGKAVRVRMSIPIRFRLR